MEIPYLEYCGLTEKPFGLTPDPFFYFEPGNFRAATEHLRFFLDQKEGFALVYGDVGLGKTTISRIFLDNLDKELYHTALLLNPIMDEAEFLKQVLKELAVPVHSRSREELLENLKDFLLDAYRNGKETVLVIDEAQLLSSHLFEFIRVLSNFETDKQKLLHIILFAQPEIIQRFSEPGMRYLAQRITVIYRLAPLGRERGLSLHQSQTAQGRFQRLCAIYSRRAQTDFSCVKGMPAFDKRARRPLPALSLHPLETYR